VFFVVVVVSTQFTNPKEKIKEKKDRVKRDFQNNETFYDSFCNVYINVTL
jgi:hypothetical protein